MQEEFLKDPKHIRAWLKSVGVKGYKIRPDGVVDVAGGVNLWDNLGSLTKLPIQFGKVSGSFDCHDNHLITLEGSPQKVGGDFGCDNNKLTTLEGGPKEVGMTFYCDNNQLTRLEGSPKKVGWLDCHNNQLKTLEGAPKEIGELWCFCNNLVDFVGLEDTKIIKGIHPMWQSSHSSLPEGKRQNTIVTLRGLREEHYGQVQGLDVEAIKGRDQDASLDIMV